MNTSPHSTIPNATAWNLRVRSQLLLRQHVPKKMLKNGHQTTSPPYYLVGYLGRFANGWNSSSYFQSASIVYRLDSGLHCGLRLHETVTCTFKVNSGIWSDLLCVGAGAGGRHPHAGADAVPAAGGAVEGRLGRRRRPTVLQQLQPLTPTPLHRPRPRTLTANLQDRRLIAAQKDIDPEFWNACLLCFYVCLAALPVKAYGGKVVIVWAFVLLCF